MTSASDGADSGNGSAGAPARSARRRLATALVVAILLVCTAAFAYHMGTGTDQAEATATPTPTPSETADPTTSELYAAVTPSVVVIKTEGGIGSGVIVTTDGGIMTALHVVDGASEITVTFSDGTTASASVASSDAATDIATLTVDTLPETLVPATIGDSSDLETGEDVIAIGTPLGLSWSVSTGVVSGLDRSTTSKDGTALSGLIQFDAAVNPGSSGGPLVRSDGTVVGIVVALLSSDGDDVFSGIGLAVPITSAVGGSGGEEGPQL
ncbi:MAG: trypsin-like peptidase domain-containing protein [Microbacterium sp.]|uniref:S1C family serine protease n=1 Tax=Microbacterium sp. TaxID=51671 RepID=UPI0039E65582